MPSPNQTPRIDVLGCGVIGLTSAIRLAEAGYAVRILARERTPNTTSDIAAAVWYPFHAGPPEKALRWGAATYTVLAELALTQPEAGVRMVEGVELFTTRLAEDPWWHAVVEGFRRAKAAELPPGYVDGVAFTSPVVQMPIYLPWLEARFLAAGGRIEAVEVGSLDARLGEAECVVNCTGLAAAGLTGDALLHPIRGQIVRVAPGGADRFVQDTHDPQAITYVIPRPDCVVLGGTAEVGAWDLTPDPQVAEAILARARALVPGLAGAQVLSHAVGLRPGRPTVRLEVERRAHGTLIHNYGHGGSGVTLAWGCADEVVGLVRSELGED